MRVAQISDLHFTHVTFNPFRLLCKRAIGTLNWLFNRKVQVSFAPLTSLPQLFEDLGVDAVLVPGDLTSTSLETEYEDAQRFFAQIRQPTFFIPGNHDHYTKGADQERRFYRYFSNERETIRHPVDFFTLRDHYVEAHRFHDWWIVALDTTSAMPLASSNGAFSEKTEKYLIELLSLIPKEEPIVLMNHFPFFNNDEPQHWLLRAERLRAIIERQKNIRLYLHGHTHRHVTADLQPSGLPLILDAGCPILMSHATWNLIDLEAKQCEVHTYRWNETAWEKEKTESFVWSRT